MNTTKKPSLKSYRYAFQNGDLRHVEYLLRRLSAWRSKQQTFKPVRVA